MIGVAIRLPSSLIIGKVEQFILDDRPADGTAKLIPFRTGQCRGRVERVPRLCGVGVPEPESAAMDVVGTGLG